MPTYMFIVAQDTRDCESQIQWRRMQVSSYNSLAPLTSYLHETRAHRWPEETDKSLKLRLMRRHEPVFYQAFAIYQLP